jgi:radical SAM protein with 4Fe4S-binding SPASM domain
MTLQGLGEPFLHKDIFEMIEYTRALGIYTRFNTNFTIFDDAMAERLVRGGHSEVMISIESIEPKLFADIRRRGDLDTVLTNIKRLSDAKRRLGSETPKIEVNAVLLKSTIELAPKLAAEMRRVGASRLNFQGLNTDGIPEKVKLLNGTRMVDNSLSSLTDAEIESITKGILALGDTDFPVTITGDLGGRDSAHRPASGILTCSDLWESPYIDSAGRVTPCCWLPDGDIMTLGDLRKNTFREIWFGREFEQLRRQHVTGCPPDVCKNCQKLTLIIENGTARAHETGSAEHYDHFFLGASKQ